jgi:AraC-like DNA-binding protein
LQFDATQGGGGLFADMLELIPRRVENQSEQLRTTIGRQLVELLVLALQEDERTLTAGGTAVRAAHLSRIEACVRRRIGDSSLDSETIARACRISVRYLHELFRDADTTLGGWIRDQRLEACREALGDPFGNETIAEIGYKWGFSGQAQFSRAFRAQFGVPPRDYREQALMKRAAAV